MLSIHTGFVEEIYPLSNGRFHLILLFCLLTFFRATPMAYGGSQARGLIGATATGLCQSHSNVGSEPRLRLTPQLTAMLDPQPTEQGQEANPQLHHS